MYSDSGCFKISASVRPAYFLWLFMVSTIAALGAAGSGFAATAATLGAGAATIGGADGNVLDFDFTVGAAFAGGAAFALDVVAVLAM